MLRLLWAGLVLCWLGIGERLEADERALLGLKRQYELLRVDFVRQMEELAERCEAESFFTDAARIRKRASSPDSGEIDYDDLPTQRLPELPVTSRSDEWRVKLRHIEREYAAKLYALAKRAMEARLPSFAFQLVREQVYHDPDHDQGRKLLGYVRYDAEWTTPFSRSMRVAGFVDDPEFGWIPKAHVDRYQAGQRLYNGRWMPVEREAAERRDFRNGWEIKTEHFYIKTNHSLEQGVFISRQLEAFYRYFMREYAAFFSTPQQMQKLFSAGASSRAVTTDQYRIFYFADREDFTQMLQAKNQNVLIATGFYLPQERTTFFYYDDDPEVAETNQQTMFHEVTHQLLAESSRKPVNSGQQRDFWIVEGFACYMESFRLEETADLSGKEGGDPVRRVSIGDPRHPRIYWAKRKALLDEFYIPMGRFMALGKDAFQSPANDDLLHAYYSQATGLVHFFLHYEDGQYRDALIEYLSQVYSPIDRIRLRPATLDKLTGVPFATLDQQYLNYLRTLETE